MPEVHLLLGSNMGDREALLAAARARLCELVAPLSGCSSIHTTAPWGEFDLSAPPPEPFANQAVSLHTTLPPHDLLAVIHLIENELGRRREQKNDPSNSRSESPCKRLYNSRMIDIDMIFYGDQVIKTERLIIPHPHMCERLFVLEPLCEICPQKEHPVRKKNIRELLNLNKNEKV